MNSEHIAEKRKELWNHYKKLQKVSSLRHNKVPVEAKNYLRSLKEFLDEFDNVYFSENPVKVEILIAMLLEIIEGMEELLHLLESKIKC